MMTNTTNRENVFNHLLNGYTESAYTDQYIMGFAFQDMVYMSFVSDGLLPYVMKLDKASRGQGYSLRFKPNKSQKALLLTYAKPLCSKKFFEECVANSKFNKGEVYEKMVTEYFGQVWKKDNIPYTIAGDITVDGVAYQIKFESATFTNEKALASLRK